MRKALPAKLMQCGYKCNSRHLTRVIELHTKRMNADRVINFLLSSIFMPLYMLHLSHPADFIWAYSWAVYWLGGFCNDTLRPLQYRGQPLFPWQPINVLTALVNNPHRSNPGNHWDWQRCKEVHQFFPRQMLPWIPHARSSETPALCIRLYIFNSLDTKRHIDFSSVLFCLSGFQLPSRWFLG